MYASGERLERSTTQAISLMQKTATDVSIINFTGNPEGFVAANPASLCHVPSTGEIYRKDTGTGNTGWVLVGDVVTLTPDSGGAVTAVSGTIDVFGEPSLSAQVMSTTNVANDLMVENRAWETAYVVDPSSTVGTRGTFTTIQDAIDASVLDGVATASRYATILIRNVAGGYFEDVNIPSGVSIHLKGIVQFPIGDHNPTRIVGTLTIAGSYLFLENVQLVPSATYSLIQTLGAEIGLNNAYVGNMLLDGALVRGINSRISGLSTSGSAQNATVLLDHCQLSGTWVLTNTSSVNLQFCNWLGTSGSIQFNDTSFFVVSDCSNLAFTGNTTLGGDIYNTSFKDTINLPNATSAVFGIISESAHAALKADLVTAPLSPTVLLASYQGNIVYRRIVSGTGDVTVNDQYVACTQAGAITLTLSTSGGVFKRGQNITIADESGTAKTNPITIAPGAGTINGASSVVINQNYASQTITFDGTNWFTNEDPFSLDSWTDITGVSQTIAINNGYLSNNAGTVAFTLPATAVQFSQFKIVGVQGAWTLSQAANQQIQIGNTATTLGVGGSLASTNAGDCIECIAVVGGASTIWRVMSMVGNITVV